MYAKGKGGTLGGSKLPPLHRHDKGVFSEECETTGCARPLTLPSLSALGIADTSKAASAALALCPNGGGSAKGGTGEQRGPSLPSLRPLPTPGDNQPLLHQTAPAAWDCDQSQRRPMYSVPSPVPPMLPPLSSLKMRISDSSISGQQQQHRAYPYETSASPSTSVSSSYEFPPPPYQRMASPEAARTPARQPTTSASGATAAPSLAYTAAASTSKPPANGRLKSGSSTPVHESAKSVTASSEANAEGTVSDNPHVSHFSDANSFVVAGVDDLSENSVQRCLWSTCTQIFNSIDELVRHLYKLHVATNRASNYHTGQSVRDTQVLGTLGLKPSTSMSSSVPVFSSSGGGPRQQKIQSLTAEFLCRWASCHARKHDTDELIDHVCKDHLDASQILHRCGWVSCGQDFETIEELTEHLSSQHIGSGRSNYVCEWEGCDRGGKPFAQRQRALRHIQTHTGAKPFACKVCAKRFSEAHIMQQHLRVHTGERPFKCEQSGCGKEFAVSSALTIHTRTHTGEKPYECKFEGCTRRFAESSNLTKHTRIHTGERPFKCPQTACGKTFSRPDQVTRHQRMHSGEKPFACPVDRCKKKFATTSTRLNHLRSLHPDASMGDASAHPASGEHPSLADGEQTEPSHKHPRLSLVE